MEWALEMDFERRAERGALGVGILNSTEAPAASAAKHRWGRRQPGKMAVGPWSSTGFEISRDPRLALPLLRPATVAPAPFFEQCFEVVPRKKFCNTSKGRMYNEDSVDTVCKREQTVATKARGALTPPLRLLCYLSDL